MGVSENLCSFLKEVKPLVLYSVELGMAMEPMKGKWASSCVDFGYTDLMSIPELTSEFISSCDSVLGDSLLFCQENCSPYLSDSELWIALHPMQGNQDSFPGEGYV